MDEQAQRVADAAAGTSIFAAFFAHAAQVNEVLQMIAYLVAILSGCAAIYFHVTRAEYYRKR
jgi:lauroyl/myristoyl acyltransferase